MGKVITTVCILVYGYPIHFYQLITRLDIHAPSIRRAAGDDMPDPIWIIVFKKNAGSHRAEIVMNVLIVPKRAKTLVRRIQLAQHIVHQDAQVGPGIEIG